MDKKVYIMLDNETTGTDPRTALAWQVGMIAFTSDYNKVCSFEVTSGIPEREWDKDTFIWARSTYSASMFLAATTRGQYEYKHAMVDVQDWIGFLTDKYGIKNVFLICNHVEFDWPILLNSFAAAGLDPKSSKEIIYYRNKLDLQSLCIGKAGNQHESIYKTLPSSRENVTHHALADCSAQINMLKAFGVELPE